MSVEERPLRIDEFDYELPQELIAQDPLDERDRSRLMVVERSGGRLVHSNVGALPDWLRAGDLLVVNNTLVIPARLTGRKPTGGRVELLLLHRSPDGVWSALGKPAKGLPAGQRIRLVGTTAATNEGPLVEIVERRSEGELRIRFVDQADGDVDALGSMPLPPYIKHPLEHRDRYQTIYGSVPGSAAAPTAGLHITERLRQRLRAKGVGWAEITLHIGLDTFRPMTVELVANHRIHAEWCSLSAEVAADIGQTKERGGRVVAVGTTSARTIETWSRTLDKDARGQGFSGWADLFITPGYAWQVVDGMLTNFHLPRSTLLLMVSSFAGVDFIRSAYREAISERYRFYSFGDAMLIL